VRGVDNDDAGAASSTNFQTIRYLTLSSYTAKANGAHRRSVVSTIVLFYLFTVIICPIAIVYSMGQIINSVCVCHSSCMSVCVHSRDRISCSIFAESGINVTTHKSKN